MGTRLKQNYSLSFWDQKHAVMLIIPLGAEIYFLNTIKLLSFDKCEHSSLCVYEYRVERSVFELSLNFLLSQMHVIIKVWASITRKRIIFAQNTRTKAD